MTSEPSFRDGAEFFTSPTQSNHRRYEALRAYFVEGLTHEQAGRRFGYTRWAMVSLVRDHRAGRLELFAPPRKPGPKREHPSVTARARDRVIELRLEGLSVRQIALRLVEEGIPLGRAGVSQVLAQAGLEGRRRLARASSRLPGTRPLDFDALPDRQPTALAGLLLTVPNLVALDLPALVNRAGYPDTRRIPAVSWLLSLLALKLLVRKRGAAPDPAAALLAGLTALPRELALTDYSYWPAPSVHRVFLAQMAQAGADIGLVVPGQNVFEVDVQAIPHWNCDPELEPGALTASPQKAIALFAADAFTGNLVFADAGADPQTLERGLVMAFLDHCQATMGTDPRLLVLGRRAASRKVLCELHERGVAFLAARPGSPGLTAYLGGLSAQDYSPVRAAGKDVRVHDQPAVPLPGFPGHVRQLSLVAGAGDPTVIITNDLGSSTADLLEHHLRQRDGEKRLAELVRAYGAESSSSVNINVDVEVMLYVLVQSLLAATGRRLPALAASGPAAFRRQVLELPGHIAVSDDTITIHLDRGSWSQILHKAELPERTSVPWWGGRVLRYQIG